MQQLVDQFVAYCDANLMFDDDVDYRYRSLPVCIIDCVYSLRAPYYSVTLPIVDRYAHHYMNGNRYAPGDTLTAFLTRIEAIGGPQAFADTILKNHQKLGGKHAIPKEDVCFQLASFLKHLRIDTLADFQDYECPELLEIVVRSVKGLGDAGTNYLFMLAGDSDRCKPDVHIHRCIRDACGQDLSDTECHRLFSEAVEVLKERHPSLTVRTLDGIIWHKYQRKKESH